MANQPSNMNRRDFIKKAAVATAGLLAKPNEVSAQQKKPVYKIEVENVPVAGWPKEKYNWIEKKWSALKADFIEWLLYLETFREAPTRHGDGMWTTGAGLTWEETATYVPNDKTKIASITKKRTRSINKITKNKFGTFYLAEYYPQKVPKDSKGWEDHVKLHMYAETLSSLYDKLNAKGMLNISDEKLIGLVGMRWLGLYGIDNTVGKLKDAKTKQAVADAFYLVISGNGGAVKRSYACGLMAAGFVGKGDVLNLSQDGWSSMPVSMYAKKDKNKKFAGFDISKSIRTEFLSKQNRGLVKSYRDKYFKDLSKSNRESQPVQEEVADNESMRLTLDGLEKVKQGKYAEAEKLYLEALKKDPSNIEAIADLGFVYLRLGDEAKKTQKTQEAIKYYDKAVSSALKAKDVANSESDKEFVANAYFNSGEAMRSIADIYMDQKKKSMAEGFYEAAKTEFGNANKFNPKDIYDKKEKEMMSKLKELKGLALETESLLDYARKLRDDKSLSDNERWTKIVKEITPAKIKSSGLSDSDKAKCWYIQGRASENLEKRKDAVDAYRKVIELAPNSDDASNAKIRTGWLLELQEEIGEEKTNPSFGQSLIGLGLSAGIIAVGLKIGLKNLSDRKEKVSKEKSDKIK